MKTCLMVAMVALILYGCDNSEEFLEELNDQPRISIVDLENVSGRHSYWYDSAKISSTELGLFPYRFQLYVEDVNKNVKTIGVDNSVLADEDTLNGFLLFQYDTILIDVEVVGVDEQQQLIDLEVLAFDEALMTLNFIAVDDFGRSDTASLQLEVFSNLPPVVNFDVRRDEAGRLIRIIDLSTSYDQDRRFGGAIYSYHWIIEGTEFSLTRDFIQFPFPGSGTYEVQAYVTDNNLAQSQFKTIEISIP